MKKLGLGVAIVLVCLVIFSVVRSVPPDEPTYQGEPLVCWMRRMSMGNIKGFEQAEAALTSMGTNAIPPLMHMLTAHDSRLKLTLMRYLARIPRYRVSFVRDSEYHYFANFGFETLGPVASNAVPDLIAVYQKNSSIDIRVYAAVCLASIGPAARAAIPALMEGATNRPADLAVSSISALGRMHSDPDVVVPFLTQFLNDRNQQIRLYAALNLAVFGPDTPGVMTALTNQLAAPDYHDRVHAIYALSRMETNATDLTALISRMTNDPQTEVSDTAMQVLARADHIQ